MQVVFANSGFFCFLSFTGTNRTKLNVNVIVFYDLFMRCFFNVSQFFKSVKKGCRVMVLEVQRELRFYQFVEVPVNRRHLCNQSLNFCSRFFLSTDETTQI